MTQSCGQEGARGNRRVPPKGRAGGSWGKPGFPHATEPQAREAA